MCTIIELNVLLRMHRVYLEYLRRMTRITVPSKKPVCRFRLGRPYA